MLYRIRCSSLTKKTHLSFHSFNSIFSDCVRYSHIISSSSFLPSHDNSQDSPVTSQTFNSKKCSFSSGSHAFTTCSWDNNGLTSKGGAIHIAFSDSRPSLTLTIDKCTFLHCHEPGTVDGGAVHARYIGAASVSDSFFYDCACGSNTGHEGAGICFDAISQQPSIIRCTFISCTTADDGGGCGVWFSKADSVYALASCVCIECKGTHVDNSQGGGIMIAHNTDPITCTNCLLSACETKCQGGGIWINYPTGKSIKAMTFCFFHENKSPSGKDICFFEYSRNTQPILYSFSSNRASGRVDGGPDTWLPRANMNHKVTASYGGRTLTE